MSANLKLSLVPGMVQIEFDLAPVYNVLTSLYLVALAGPGAQFSPWVMEVATALPKARHRTHRLVFDLLYSAYEPEAEFASFPDYLAHLKQASPETLQQRFLRHMFPQGDAKFRAAMLADPTSFAAELDRSELDQAVDDELLAAAHRLVTDPPALASTVLAHLTYMWEAWMADEWARHVHWLAEIVTRYQAQQHQEQNAYDAIKTVTGRTVGDDWRPVLASARRVRFIPSPHVGSYLLHINYPPMLRIVFGAHSPATTNSAPGPFRRLELLVQLRALAEDARLRIVELVAHEPGLCTQDIVERLSLSKSNASRHLSQLTAAGFLTEEQRPGKVKCYRLNPASFVKTGHSLQSLVRPAPGDR